MTHTAEFQETHRGCCRRSSRTRGSKVLLSKWRTDPAEKPVPQERVLLGHAEMVDARAQDHKIRETIGRKSRRRNRFGNNATRRQESEPDGGKEAQAQKISEILVEVATRRETFERSSHAWAKVHNGRNDRVQRRDSGAWTRNSVGSLVALQSPSFHPITLSPPRSPRPVASTASGSCI